MRPPETSAPQPQEHVHAAYRDFGLKGMTRALCTCGYATPPAPDSDAALQLLLHDHGARRRRPGEEAGVPY